MPLPADDDSDRRSFKPFLEHMEDLRRALMRSVLALVAGMIVAIPLARPVFHILKLPLVQAGKDPETFLKVFQVTGGVSVAMTCILLTGVLISAPFIVFFVAEFVFPGLTGRERQGIRKFGVAAVLLFATGAAMCYFLILPIGFKVMFAIGDWIGVQTDFLAASDYIAFCLYLLLAFGLAFELPVVIVLLGYLGILSSQQLRARRSYVIVGILLLAAVATPDPTILSQIVMSVPLIILHEAAIWLVRLRELREERP